MTSQDIKKLNIIVQSFSLRENNEWNEFSDRY